jgi:hypothetical protein
MKLIRGVHKVSSNFFAEAGLPLFHDMQEVACVLAIDLPKLEQSKTVVCQSDRNNRKRDNVFAKFVKIEHCFPQDIAVVNTGTEYNLCVHVDIMIMQKPDLFEDLVILLQAHQ